MPATDLVTEPTSNFLRIKGIMAPNTEGGVDLVTDVDLGVEEREHRDDRTHSAHGITFYHNTVGGVRLTHIYTTGEWTERLREHLKNNGSQWLADKFDNLLYDAIDDEGWTSTDARTVIQFVDTLAILALASFWRMALAEIDGDDEHDDRRVNPIGGDEIDGDTDVVVERSPGTLVLVNDPDGKYNDLTDPDQDDDADERTDPSDER